MTLEAHYSDWDLKIGGLLWAMLVIKISLSVFKTRR